MNTLDFNEFEKPKEKKKEINFNKLPESSKEILGDNQELTKQQKEEVSKRVREELLNEQPIPTPTDISSNQTNLSMILSPNFRDLELMIRGLEFVKKNNLTTGKEEIVLRRIKEHPLNETGVNKIMEFLRVYASPEIKLGRKKARDYYNSVQSVGHSVVRLIYKNLKNFGMDTQIKQRNAKTFCLAIIEVIDASYSRSIEGKENDISRPTEFKVEGNIDTINDPAKLFNRQQKENMKN